MSEQNGHNAGDKIADAAGKVFESVRNAIEEGLEAVRPTWEEKVAPAVASGAEKVAEWGDSVRESADRKSAELSAEDRPSSKILGGALGVGAAAVALGTGATRAIGKAAAESAADDEAAPAAQPAEADAAPAAEPAPEPAPATPDEAPTSETNEDW